MVLRLLRLYLRRGGLGKDLGHAAECDQDDEQKNPSSVTIVYGTVSRIGPTVSTHRGGMGVKDLSLCCHNILSVNEFLLSIFLVAGSGLRKSHFARST